MFKIRLTILFLACGGLSGCAWSRFAQNDSLKESQLLVTRAQQMEEKGDLEAAKRMLALAAETNPEDADIHRRLAQLQLETGDVHQALERLNRAVKQNPEDTKGLVEISRILVQQNQHPEAFQTIQAVLKLDPNHVDALLLLGDLEQSRNHRESALEAYHRVLAIDSEHVDARLQVALLQIQNGEYDRAAPVLRWICQCPRTDELKRTEANWLLGILYGRQSRWSDAVESLSAAIVKRNSVPADDWYRLAYARFKAGDKFGAARDLKVALQQNPGHVASLAMASSLGYQSAVQAGRIVAIQAVAPAVPAPPGWE